MKVETKLILSSPRQLLAILVLSGVVIFWLVRASMTLAAPPEETRPYLELPFPGGTSYQVNCAYGCYQHRNSMLYGVDFDIPSGAPIVAAAPGTVMAVTWELGLPANLNLGDALIVYIDHGNNWFTRYVHLSGITVEVGDSVEMGDVIGYSGKTGASGDHLHFELKYGTSLHSASVPIDELFGGQEPLAGYSYLSNNRYLAALASAPPLPAPPPPTPTASLVLPAPTQPSLHAVVPQGPQATTVPAPQVAASFENLLPQLEEHLSVTEDQVRAGDTVTVTFTLRNNGRERLRLSMLGVAGHAVDDSQSDDTLVFDRSIVLNPGRSYRFERLYQFDMAGRHELFIFALNPDNEWIPLGGDGQSVQIQVSAGSHELFLPLLNREAPTRPARVRDDDSLR